MVTIDSDKIAALKRPERIVFELMKAGLSIRELYSQSHYYRFRNHFRGTYGIDIDRPLKDQVFLS